MSDRARLSLDSSLSVGLFAASSLELDLVGLFGVGSWELESFEQPFGLGGDY